MNYLSKKIEQAFVLWFEASNQWVQFNEQQWFIFNLYHKKVTKEKALEKFCKRFALKKDYSQEILSNYYESFQKLFYPNFDLPNFSLNTHKACSHVLLKKKTYKYLYLQKVFSITYGSQFLENYIHFPIAHLNTVSTEECSLHLEVFSLDNRFILRINGKEGRCLSTEEPGQIKRLLYIELANLFFNKKDNDWMTFIHASSLKRNNEALILTATGGSGKSTMAGLLLQNGFEFISDDFVPVDLKAHKVFPFPAALCLKNDAASLLNANELSFITNNKTNSVYAKPLNKQPVTTACFANKIVFINYNKEVDINFKQIPTLEALQLFLLEAWVGDDLIRAKKFITWFAKLNFYKLEYGNSEKAIEVLSTLMDKA